MSNEKMVMVTADTKDLLGMSPAAAEAILSNCRVQIELTGDEATPPGAQGKSLYPVHLDADQLQILKDLLEQASSREADPDSPIFQMLDKVRAARRRSPHFKLSPAGAITVMHNNLPFRVQIFPGVQDKALLKSTGDRDDHN